MEGIRALPWFRDRVKRGSFALDDCTTCKERTSTVERQSLGCGYEPPADGKVHLNLWQPPRGTNGYTGDDLTVCAGYTTNLPEVTEVSIGRAHWSKGNANILPQNEDLLNAIIVAESASNQLQHWLMTPPKDGGGGA